MIHSSSKVAWALVAGGCALLFFGTAQWATGAWREKTDRQRFRDQIEQAPAPAATVDIPKGEASIGVGILRIDRLGFSVLVREGAGSKQLAQGAGWIPGTARPGDSGNVGIAGHRDTFFRDLRHVRIGDGITLVTPRGQRNYVVEETSILSPEAVEVLRPTTRSVLTLVTCYPFYFVGSAPQRFIVRASGG